MVLILSPKPQSLFTRKSNHTQFDLTPKLKPLVKVWIWEEVLIPSYFWEPIPKEVEGRGEEKAIHQPRNSRRLTRATFTSSCLRHRTCINSNRLLDRCRAWLPRCSRTRSCLNCHRNKRTRFKGFRNLVKKAVPKTWEPLALKSLITAQKRP